ncbi:glucoside xylosyltransferase 2 [Drosophila tropicalis]|uniref:glucoside xylosyltransferase 2 n=1 Tax=Drosophila tropicalis TaxID=46794 RepID=UPI0035AB8631
MQHLSMYFLGISAFATVLYILLQSPSWEPDEGSLTTSHQMHKGKSPLHIVVVSCGQRVQETLVMIKSALLFNTYEEYLKFVIFTENSVTDEFREKLTDWKDLLPYAFDFELLQLKFPNQNEVEWKNLFKPCAAQRLFLPSLLTNVDSLLYVDTDVLFLSPISDLWTFFKKFNETQMAALTPEHESENIGWYNRFARHPFYGKLGVNSGVMLMNLTRMREFNWEKQILPIHKEYKLRITWGDQDIINILFYYHPDKLYVMPCEYNYRPDHCMYMSVCSTSRFGIKLIHGNRGYFHFDKQPLFKIVYEIIESYPLGSNPYTNFLLPLRRALNQQSVNDSSCGKISSDVLKISSTLFDDLSEALYKDDR